MLGIIPYKSTIFLVFAEVDVKNWFCSKLPQPHLRVAEPKKVWAGNEPAQYQSIYATVLPHSQT